MTTKKTTQKKLNADNCSNCGTLLPADHPLTECQDCFDDPTPKAQKIRLYPNQPNHLKIYPKIEQKDWAKHGVEPPNWNDPEDGGYRNCPACKGAAYESPKTNTCDTCRGIGHVQWEYTQ